ncbi:MAG: FAD-dependent oxidoreductase [Lachnospiraceae bacterium]|nr:FAD-dependent oxidoreductase [Lachnospiraceae bacterium]
MYDIIVIGGGPAGLTAALYALRNGKKVMVVEKDVFGGQITNSPRVENIPGFASIGGDEFADAYLEQVMGQGGEVVLDEVTSLVSDGETVTVTTAAGETLTGRSAVIATGTKHRVLGLPGEEDLIGNGVHFCAVCDGDFYRDKAVCMIGGGNSAFVEGNLLADTVSKLIMLQDLPFFTADEKLQKQLLGRENVETHVGTKILALETEGGRLTGVRYSENGTEKTAACDGLFLAIGFIPDNELFSGVAELDERGYFASGESCVTRTPNVFVAGDCRSKSLRQVTTACADGAVAAIAACAFINK